MELSREAIIRETHFGVKVYAHVMRKYYPGNVMLRLKRNSYCLPVRNPFNGDKETLHVEIVDGVARHRDEELNDFKGDAFDFAALHYRLEEPQLLERLDEEMGLGIGCGFDNCNSAEQVVMDKNSVSPLPTVSPGGHFIKTEGIELPMCSFFKKPVRNTTPMGSVSLLEIYQKIRGATYQRHTNALRAIQDEKEARAYKAERFDFVTFSGVFVKRENSALVHHSGLFCVDFDHLEDVAELKQRLLQDTFFETALLFVSPSGKGLKWVIPIDITKATHQQYAVGIGNYLLKTYGQKMDASGKDVARACFLPHDPNIYINTKYL